MRYCTNCGVPLQNANQKYCPNCGSDLFAESNQAGNQTPPAPAAFDPAAQIKKHSPDFAPLGLDRATFFKKYSAGRQNCVAAAVLGYICAGSTIVLALTNWIDFINIYSLLDVIIILTLSLLIHLLRSRIASVLMLAYAAFNTVSMLLSVGEFAGWLGVVAGILAVVGSFQCVKEWKAYQARSQATPQNTVPML